MSDLSLMSDISMTELRMLSVAGLVATAVISTLVALLLASGGAALGRLVRHGLDRYRGAPNGTMASTASPPESRLLVPNGKRELQTGQAAWRPRL
jgi:hypothetical protein